MSLTVVLWLWRTQTPGRWGSYGPMHVNRAATMIRANLRMQHEIACITDDPTDIDSSIRIIPLWPDLADLGRCWRRLKVFSPEMGEVIGPRFCWIDLDCVITGDLTRLFDRPEDIVLWRSQTTTCHYNGSMLLHRAGTRAHIWETFVPGQPFWPRSAGSDQAWIAHVLGPNEPVWTQHDGVLAYNKYCRSTVEAPKKARIVFFPGTLKSNSDVARLETPWVQRTLEQYGSWDEADYNWQPRPSKRFRPRPPPPLKQRGTFIRSWAR